jgi:hypothetical protein
MRVLACAFLLAGLAGCSTAPPLEGSVAAEIVRTEIWTGMTKTEVLRLVGRPRWRLPSGPNDVRGAAESWRFGPAGDVGSPPECWAWGDDARYPDTTVCFTGVDHRVVSKSP